MSFDDFDPKDVPITLSNKILQDSNDYIEPPLQRTILKYLGIFLVSILFSLVICPQNGVGLLRIEFPIYHSIFHSNMLLCGFYCGFVFFATTHLISFYLLNHFERVVLFKKVGYLPAIAMSLFFAFSMTPIFSFVDFSLLYAFGWLGTMAIALYAHKKTFTLKFELENTKG